VNNTLSRGPFSTLWAAQRSGSWTKKQSKKKNHYGVWNRTAQYWQNAWTYFIFPKVYLVNYEPPSWLWSRSYLSCIARLVASIISANSNEAGSVLGSWRRSRVKGSAGGASNDE
jgi:hypothetical protein